MSEAVSIKPATSKHSINLTSLNLVRDETVVTIEQAATQLEGYVTDRENTKLLDACITSLEQIRGSLLVVELYGATDLAGELLSTAKSIRDDHNALEDEKLSALTKGFFVLSCYFEYVLQRESGFPALLVPYINEIKTANRAPILWESHYAKAMTSYRAESDQPAEVPSGGDTIETVARRYRHMFQVGLLGVIRNLRLSPSLQLMARAVNKFKRLASSSNSYTLWWVLENALNALMQSNMEMTVERKRLFGQIDKVLRKIEKMGTAALDEPINDELLKELSYYIALSGLDEKPFSDIRVAFGYSDLGYSEAERLRESKTLTGPSASTVSSVAETLKTELRSAKEVIEFAENGDASAIDNYDEFIAGISKVRDILDVVGLKSAAQTMGQQLERIRNWRDSGDQMDATEMLEIADAFIYVESVLDSIEKRNFSDEKLSEINQLSRNQMIVNSHLADAQLVVLEEVEAGLTMVKRALSSFAESNFDRVHIKNVAKTLNSVRGGMIVLELPRAADVVASSVQFIEGSLLSNNQPAAVEHMLETFADAIICLEYYLDCLKVDKNINPDTLVIAEESLAALGYGVGFSE